MSQVLRQPPADDPRPVRNSVEVVRHAMTATFPAIATWVQLNVSAKAEEDDIAHIISSCMSLEPEAYRAARYLEAHAGWTVDMGLVRLLDQVSETLTFSHRLVVQAWVLRSGVRFPAKEQDRIVWLHNGRRRTGVVSAVNQWTASALVTPVVGLAVIAELSRVLAEEVVTNETQKALVVVGASK